MEKTHKIDWATVRSNLEAKKKARNAEATFGPVFRAAAVRPVFVAEELLGFAKKLPDPDPRSREEELKVLLTQAEPMKTSDGTERWRLADELRQKILTDLSTLSRISPYLPPDALQSSDLRQRWLARYIGGERPSLNTLSLADLNAICSTAFWLAAYTSDGIPHIHAVQTELKRKELMAPLQNITEHFQGRSEQLTALTRFVQQPPEKVQPEQYRYERTAMRAFCMMVYGIGGAGKTTLVSKFILDQLNERDNKGFGFGYFDFDRPDSRLAHLEPLLLLDEMTRQLELQNPADAILLQGMRQDWKLALEGISASRGFERDFYLEKLGIWWQQQDPMRPLLLVLDSFEEVQNWATDAERDGLLRYLLDLKRVIPNLKVVFSGRANVDYFDMQPLEIGDFDEISALGYLKSQEVQMESCAREIWKYVGGNPLDLKLAATEAVKAGCENLPALLRNIDKKRIREVLFRRQLEHIHDQRVQKLAVPGLIVRLVNPDVIREVLAVPCDLGPISEIEAAELMERMQKEAFLVHFEEDNWRFRSDLRTLLIDLSALLNPQKTKMIHDRAVDFYAPRKDPASRAEWLYHRLKRGDAPETLGEIDFTGLQPFLRQSFSELPADVLAFLAGGLKIQLPGEVVRNIVDLSQWEKNMAVTIENSFITAEEDYLNRLATDLAGRPERSPNSPLYLQEALLSERLNRLDASASLLNIVFHDAQKALDFEKALQSKIRLAALMERQQDFERALQEIDAARSLGTDLKFPMHVCRIALLQLRIGTRLGSLNSEATKTMLDRLEQTLEFSDVSSQDAHLWLHDLLPDNFFSRELQKASTKNVVSQASSAIDNSRFSFHRFRAAVLERLSTVWQKNEDFVRNLATLRNIAPDNEALETLARNRLQRPLREICLPGTWEICSYDLLLFVEKEGQTALLLAEEVKQNVTPPPNKAPDRIDSSNVAPNNAPLTESRSVSALLREMGVKENSGGIEQEIKELIAEGDTERALDILLEFTKSNPAAGSLQEEVLLHSARYQSALREQRMGMLDSTYFRRVEAQISSSLLDLLQRLAKRIDLQITTNKLSDLQISGNNTLERIIGNGSNLVKISWLEKALRVSQSIGLRRMPEMPDSVVFWIQDQEQTKTIRAMSVVLGADPEQARYEFNFQEFKGGINAGKTYKPRAPFVVDRQLGFCITGFSATDEPVNSLSIAKNERPTEGQKVFVISHSGQQISLNTASVYQTTATSFEVQPDERVFFLPGSPVFNDKWVVVGMIREGNNAVPMTAVAQSLQRTQTAEIPVPNIGDVGSNSGSLTATKFVLLYDEVDEPHAQTLKKHIQMLIRMGKASLYLTHSDAVAGEDPWRRVEEEIKNSDYTLCLITVDLITGPALDHVFRTYEQGSGKLIPILVEKVDLDGTGLEKLRSLPTMGRSVSDFKVQDAAYVNIMEELQRLLRK